MPEENPLYPIGRNEKAYLLHVGYSGYSVSLRHFDSRHRVVAGLDAYGELSPSFSRRMYDDFPKVHGNA